MHKFAFIALVMSAFLSNADVTYAWFRHPTNSSPIALSNDNRLLWSVNPKVHSVSVIRTDNNTLLATIPVGNDPQSVALSPDNKYAFVANAADSTLSIIKIGKSDYAGFSAKDFETITTGSEPYNVVITPDGSRVFVANSGQDTITVIDVATLKPVSVINLQESVCNDPDRDRHFQPRGLAVTQDNSLLLVTRFYSFTRPGGVQLHAVADDGREGLVCVIDVLAGSETLYRPREAVTLATRDSGFKLDLDGGGKLEPAFAWPNQMQSVVIRGDRAFLPNIAASPSGPTQFQTSTEAFVNFIDDLDDPRDGGAINLHLGARVPETGKPTIFFANPWAIAFTTQSGDGHAYVVSAGSDLLVKMNVDANGDLSNTVNATTTRFIDLNDPKNPATSGDKAGKNPRGIVINDAGTVAYVVNFVSSTVSVVSTLSDTVIGSVRTAALPAPGSPAEQVLVGAEMFFSSRGHFDRPGGTTVSTDERLAQVGWQGCASCHTEGYSDSVIWAFGSGPRKSIPLDATFDFANHTTQRVLNYSAIFDEIQDFDLNIRNVSGPGALTTAVTCETPASGAATTSTFDPNHGLIAGDNGELNEPPCVINAFTKPNAGRHEFTVTLAGGDPVPALTAIKEWVAFAIRPPNAPLADTTTEANIAKGRKLFGEAGCQSCHGGPQWTSSIKDFVSPPANHEIACEVNLGAAAPPGSFCSTAPVEGNPTNNQFLHRFLRNIGSFNIGVAGGINPIGDNIGAAEKAAPVITAGKTAKALDALGFDFNRDGLGNGFSPPSLLSIFSHPPYLHNGACETLDCVLTDKTHRSAGTGHDILSDPKSQELVVDFLKSIDVHTTPF